MAAISELTCPVDGCSRTSPSKQGMSQHTRRAHGTEPKSILARKDGQVDIDLSVFPGRKFPAPMVGGFWRSILLDSAPSTWGIVAVFSLLIYQAATTSVLNAVGLVVATPAVVVAMWYLGEMKRFTQVAVIRYPPDPDGRVRIVFEWWPKSSAKKLPLEARRSGNRGDIYVIDATGQPPIVFTPFTIQPPEYAIPVRGAMVNQQVDNEQLNKIHYKGIRPETVQQAFALLVIAGLLIANIALSGQVIEFLNS